MGIFPEDINGFFVTGILSDKQSTVFIARVSFELYIISARTWNGKEPIEKMFLNGLPDRSISIATETNQYHVIYGFSPTLNLIWSVGLNREMHNALQGVFLSTSGKISIAGIINLVTIGRLRSS